MNKIPRYNSNLAYLVLAFVLISTLLAGKGIEVSAAPLPIEISNCSQLQGMKNNLSGHYVLVNPIDCTATTGWNGGLGFEPVGNISNEFNGILDGAGHVINGLYINRSTDYYIGLFGYTGSQSEFRDIYLEGVNVTGKENVGGLVGSNQGTITNVSSSGSVNATLGTVGGLVGYNNADVNQSHSSAIVGGAVDIHYAGGLVGENRGMLYQAYASGTVTGKEGVGGLVGSNTTGTISQCYATGTVNGNNGKSGGLVGQNQYNNAVIIDSYATGTVNGGSGAYAAAGGLLGSNGGTGWGTETVDNSYSIGKVSGDNTGGLVGKNYNSANTITDSYWDTQTSLVGTSDAGVGKTTAEMFQQANFAGWDFSGIWSIEENRIYPWHKWQPESFSALVTCQESGQQNFLWDSSDAWGIVRQCTIDVPTNGQVLISADATLAYHNGEYEARAGIGIDNPVGDFNTDRWVSVYDHPPGGGWNSLALSTVKPLSPGTHTIYLVVTRYSGAPTAAVKIWDSTLSAIFIPTPEADLLTCEASGDNTWTTTSSDFGVIRQCTLNLPAHGWVYITADGTADLANLNYEALFNLGIDSMDGDLRIDRWLDVYDDPSGDTDTTLTLAGLLPASAGEHTFYLLGKRFSGPGTVEVYDSTLNVLYIPAPSITTTSCSVVNNNTWTSTSNLFSVVRQCTIDVPEDSQVFISANASMHWFNLHSTAHFQLSIDDSNSGDATADRFVDLNTDGVNPNDKGMALTRLQPVSAGTHTFYLLGKRNSGNGTVGVYDSTLSVIVLRDPPVPVPLEHNIYVPLILTR
jgi:hypothetical protein